MHIQPEHIKASLLNHTEHRHSTCLQCGCTGPMGLHSKKKRFSIGMLVGIGFCLLLPLGIIEFYVRSTGSSGISIIWFLLLATVPYGLSLIEDVVLACPNCDSAICL